MSELSVFADLWPWGFTFQQELKKKKKVISLAFSLAFLQLFPSMKSGKITNFSNTLFG